MKRQQKRKHLEDKESQETGILRSQEDAPQLGPTKVAKGGGAGAEDVSSASEYFSCVSSPSKLIHGSTGIQKSLQNSPQHRSTRAHVQEQGETSLLSPRVSVSPPSSDKTCVTSQHISKEKRGMKVYYMQVQVKKGVALSWETEETPESLKKLRMEEVNLPENVRVGTPPSDVSTRNLCDSETSEEAKEHEERGESKSPPGLPTVEEIPRAKTPDWLVTMETGFRCMACCRVFPSLEALKEHVQLGVREGFSCHVFHLTMAQLRSSVESEKIQEEEEEEEEEEENEEEKEKQEEKKK